VANEGLIEWLRVLNWEASRTSASVSCRLQAPTPAATEILKNTGIEILETLVVKALETTFKILTFPHRIILSLRLTKKT
jgi:hypothetical protein